MAEGRIEPRLHWRPGPDLPRGDNEKVGMVDHHPEEAMDVLWFLKDRTRFIRGYFNTAAPAFEETMRKIEEGEDPFVPPYREDDEPPFLAEWIDAKTGLDILGLSCISMLSDCLKLYFITWEHEIGIRCQPELKCEFKKGFLNGYKVCFGHILNTEWNECPVDFDVLEQMVLARNRGQHPDDITRVDCTYTLKDFKRNPIPYFISDFERRIIDTRDNVFSILAPPSLEVTREKLVTAIEQVEKLGEWLEDQMFDLKYHRKRNEKN